jgi:hypothetical protein
MTCKISLAFAVSLCLAALAGCGDDHVSPSPDSDTIHIAFQDGVSPSVSYNGTADAVLKDDPDDGAANANFGTSPSDTLGSVLLSTAFYERRLIVRMDISSITNCSAVVSARLSIHVTPPAPDSLTLEARLINMPRWKQWTEGYGGPANGVSWGTIDGQDPWLSPGGDFFISSIGEKTVSNDSVVTFSLSPASVMEWIKTPSTNHGIIIKTTDVSRTRFAIVFQHEYGVAARRPRLEIAYRPGG